MRAGQAFVPTRDPPAGEVCFRGGCPDLATHRPVRSPAPTCPHAIQAEGVRPTRGTHRQNLTAAEASRAAILSWVCAFTALPLVRTRAGVLSPAHRVLGVLRRVLRVLRRVLRVQHRVLRALHRVLGVQHRLLGVLHRVLKVLHRVLRALHRALGVQHRVLGVLHRVPGVPHRGLGC